MHRGSTRGGAKSNLTDSAPPGWSELTTTSDGKTRTDCPSLVGDVNDEVQCAFKDLSTGLIWSSRAPGMDGFREAREFLTWSDAKAACEKLGRWSGMDGWRLPTDAELSSAFLNPSGTIRQSGLLGLTDGKLSFGALPKYSFVWSVTEDPANPSQAKALFRGPSNISVGAVAKDMARGWHCVHASATIGQPLLTEAKPTLQQPNFNLSPSTTRPATAPAGLLPSVRPTPAAGTANTKGIVLGSGLTSVEAPKWALQPVNDLEHLSFITTPFNRDELQAPSAQKIPPQSKPPQQPLPKIADVPNLPTAEPAPQVTKGQNKLVHALRKAFAKIGMAHAIDTDGRLILNRAAGITFPTGEGGLSPHSLPRAKNMLRIYTEVILSEAPEVAASARLKIVGYSTPSTDNESTAKTHANKKISRRRAELIRDLVRDLNIWPSDQVSIDGRGSISPIKRSDGSSGTCGIYDCELSRRVEVSPIFKESPT